MFSFIRWSGLAIFLVLCALLALIWRMVLPTAIHYGVEEIGSQSYGARIDLDDVDLGLFPLTVELHRLQVSDKEQPMQNAFEVDFLSAQTELLPLLFGKVLVDELKLARLEFQTARASSGALETEASEQEAEQGTSLEQTKEQLKDALDQNLPSVDELLEKEPLETVDAGKALQSTYQTQKQALEGHKDNLPDKAKLKDYEARIKALTEGKIKNLEDFTQRKAELDKIIAELRADRDRIVAAKEQLSSGLAQLKGDYETLKQAPGKDYERLSQKYSLDGAGATNLVELLLGSEMANDFATAYRYYGYVSDLIGDGASGDGASGDASSEADDATEQATEQALDSAKQPSGRYVHFPSNKPWPDFWIKHIDVKEVILGERTASMEVFDLSHQQRLIGRPLLMSLRDSGDGELDLDLTIDRLGKTINDHAKVATRDWPLSPQKLGNSSIELERSRLNLDGRLELKDLLKGEFSADVLKTKFAYQSDQDDRKAKVLADILESIDAFKVAGTVVGSLESPELSVNSDLDRRLGSALKGALKAELGPFQEQLKAGLAEKLGDFAGDDVNQFIDQAAASELDLDNMSASFEKLMESKLDDYKEQAKQQAKDKLKEKLGDKLKGLF